MGDIMMEIKLYEYNDLVIDSGEILYNLADVASRCNFLYVEYNRISGVILKEPIIENSKLANMIRVSNISKILIFAIQNNDFFLINGPDFGVIRDFRLHDDIEKRIFDHGLHHQQEFSIFLQGTIVELNRDTIILNDENGLWKSFVRKKQFSTILQKQRNYIFLKKGSELNPYFEPCQKEFLSDERFFWFNPSFYKNSE